MNMDYQARIDSIRFAVRALQQAFPHLVPVSEISNSLVTAAKNIRIELASAFPRIKFSVKSSRFAGGDSIRISWRDGPTDKQVDAIAGRYEAGKFDGMTDCYDYRKDHSWTAAFGDAKYISTHRQYSPALVQKAIDYLWERYRPDADKITPDDFFQGHAWSIIVFQNGYPGDNNAQSQIHRFAHKFDCISETIID
ncbi:LPD29 domain-containing protein [Nitrosospira sp. NRS527]|uniref:LPD29 domain-containing protein n=1 Tax=Nitrosospira sp. NRS527 TaxID=155925 RepID=UPI001AF1E8ED|nr:LPD29 domain-containing protein [Nitrosospira sp. NRS527]BCT69586.1 hypothetical protein NNRS527_03211 [Nitrosospira sp. NRS527]